MKLLVLTLCLLGHALAAPMTTPVPDGHDHTKPCCMPKKWQAVLLDLKSATALQYATVFAYDADTKTEGSLTIRVEDETPVYQSFTDYNKMMTYNIMMYGDPSMHKCTSTKASHDFYDHCFMGMNNKSMVAPTYMADSVLGLASKGIPFHAWQLQFGMMNITIGLSNDGCVPLVESIKGMNGGKMIDSLMLFNDFSTNVTAELLTMPPACANV